MYIIIIIFIYIHRDSYLIDSQTQQQQQQQHQTTTINHCITKPILQKKKVTFNLTKNQELEFKSDPELQAQRKMKTKAIQYILGWWKVGVTTCDGIHHFKYQHCKEVRKYVTKKNSHILNLFKATIKHIKMTPAIRKQIGEYIAKFSNFAINKGFPIKLANTVKQFGIYAQQCKFDYSEDIKTEKDMRLWLIMIVTGYINDHPEKKHHIWIRTYYSNYILIRSIVLSFFIISNFPDQCDEERAFNTVLIHYAGAGHFWREIDPSDCFVFKPN